MDLRNSNDLSLGIFTLQPCFENFQKWKNVSCGAQFQVLPDQVLK